MGHLFRSLLLEELRTLVLVLPCFCAVQGVEKAVTAPQCDRPIIGSLGSQRTDQTMAPHPSTLEKIIKKIFFLMHADPLVRKELRAECALTHLQDSVTHFSGFHCC